MAEVLTGARARISVPAPPVATGGFLGASHVIDVGEGAHELMGAEYLTDACTFSNGWSGNWCVAPIASQCEDPGAPPANPKTFDAGSAVVEGDPFVVYAGSACDVDSLEGRLRSATAAFNYGERRSVDAAVTTWLDTIDIDMESEDAAIPCAIGLMEQWLAQNYGGVGVIALPLVAAVPAVGEGVVYPDASGSGLITAVGTPVVAYVPDTVQALPVGYALGQLTLIRGPLRTVSVPPMSRSDGTCEPARALAERIYVPLVECVVGRFTMSCCACTGATP